MVSEFTMRIAGGGVAGSAAGFVANEPGTKGELQWL